MTPERVAALVARWVRLYTRRLPRPIAQRRVEEIESDLHDHLDHERGRATPDRDIALGILSRMVRGVPADVAWRRRVQPSGGDRMKPLVTVLVAALGVAVVAFVLDSPVLLLVSVAGLVGVIVGTFLLSARTAQQGDFLVPFVAILGSALVLAAVGVAAIVFGERGDAPGLMLLGIVVITSVVVGAFAFGMRTAQRSSR
jgi:hypothetical protein